MLYSGVWPRNMQAYKPQVQRYDHGTLVLSYH